MQVEYVDKKLQNGNLSFCTSKKIIKNQNKTLLFMKQTILLFLGTCATILMFSQCSTIEPTQTESDRFEKLSIGQIDTCSRKNILAIYYSKGINWDSIANTDITVSIWNYERHYQYSDHLYSGNQFIVIRPKQFKRFTDKPWPVLDQYFIEIGFFVLKIDSLGNTYKKPQRCKTIGVL